MYPTIEARRKGLVLLLCSLISISPISAIDVEGAGESWCSELWNSWTSSYAYFQDSYPFVYSPVSEVQQGLTSMNEGFYTFVSSPADSSAFVNGSSSYYFIPVFASAMTVGFNISFFPNSSSTQLSNMLTLNDSVLASLFLGEIESWSDSKLASLNPFIRLPQSENVTMVLCDDYLGQANVLARYLSGIDPLLATSIQPSTNFAASLAPVKEGRVRLACSISEQLEILSSPGWEHSLVFLMLPDLLATKGLAPIAMATSGGRVVASASSIAQAMTDTNSTELVNQDGAWPLSTMVNVLLQTNIDTANCALVNSFLDFLAWTQLNNAAAALPQSFSAYVSLDDTHRAEMLNIITDVICNGQHSLTTAFLLGAGPPIPTYASWASDYNNAGFSLKYYTKNSLVGIQDLEDGSIDFASTGGALNSLQQAALPDAMLVPVVSYGYVFAYNIPDINNQPTPLTIDYQVAADIYLNRIKTWNHPNITALNRRIAHLLPNASIIVGYDAVPEVLTQAYSLILSMNVPEFASKVGNSTYVNLPVVEQDPNRTVPMESLEAYVSIMPNTPYLFC